jgi:hypothetical protein
VGKLLEPHQKLPRPIKICRKSYRYGSLAATALAENRRRPHIRAEGGRIARRLGRREIMPQDEMTPEERQAILRHIERLREEHRDLDAAIEALLQAGQADRLQVQRLKKRKLQLRDKLTQLEDSVTPDIIA